MDRARLAPTAEEKGQPTRTWANQRQLPLQGSVGDPQACADRRQILPIRAISISAERASLKSSILAVGFAALVPVWRKGPNQTALLAQTYAWTSL
jgi:hypothetical protein